MRHFTLLAMTGLVVAGLGAGNARAEGVWFSLHEASGSGWANLFDGGPVVTDEGATTGPDDPLMVFGALDLTQPGVFGASMLGGGRSRITPSGKDGMRLAVDLDARYNPSLLSRGWSPALCSQLMRNG